MGWLDKYQDGGEIEGKELPEITVYGKRQYKDKLKEQTDKYLADMAKYKQDSAQWIKANQAYQDSLKLYNLETNTRDFIEKHWDWIKYGNTLSIEEVENISRDANKNNYRTPLIHHGGYEATFYDKDVKTSSDHVYKKGDIRSTKDNKQEDFYTFINSTKISPIGFKPILNHGESYDKNRSYDFSPVYAKPKGTKFPTKPNSPIPIKYDPKYENLQMRSLWANKAKQDSTARIGVLNPLDYNDESKGFTIGEAMKFPQEIKDQYNIDYIGRQVGIKKYKDGGKIKYPDGGEVKRTLSGKVRDIIHKLGVPLALNQFVYDLTGGESPITEKSLTDSELNTLKKVTRDVLSKGRKYIEYDDYNKYFGDDVFEAVYNNRGSKRIEDLKNPAYNLAFMLGKSNIDINGKDTTIVDRYNFNARVQPKEFIKDLVQGNYNVRENPYFFIADIGRTFGSKEGEGSPVNIKFEKGGQLKKSNQMRNFTNGWVDKYL